MVAAQNKQMPEEGEEVELKIAEVARQCKVMVAGTTSRNPRPDAAT
jgi:hypothetical protein